ncbi:stage V sporulation protein D [Clostridium polyendosporum]|uniref:Stage V sporulation protein D n=1 Tax=Clostridium polyendosporum TaxID=69208 RepID=A0A919RWX9_9CLOT|nr:stage V sporulation protein D [Clostridium polyendosporum]GIM27987.1 stage V sporulation protein D [Clostridium polyendosporum]
MIKKYYRDNATSKKRMWVTIVLISTVFFVLTLRLSYIMIFKSKEYSARAIEQWTSRVKIDAVRGKILDRNGFELAVSGNVYRVDLDLNAIREYLKKNSLTNENISPKIADALEMDNNEVLKKLNTRLASGAPAGSAYLARRIEKDQADKVKGLKINGVLVSPDTKRYYTNNSFLAHVLGTTNVDGNGLNGVELIYNNELAGVPGVRIAEIDRRSEELPYTISNFTPPIPGKDITLTIDEKMQYFAEKAAEQALNDNKAKAVSVIVMNPKNGEILAMANKPDFNPNKPTEGAENFEGNNSMEKLQKMWRNRSVSDSFEPGSIFKVFTAIAALEESTGGGSETYNCNGSTTVLGRTIKCWKRGGHGSQTFPDILKNSCNVAFIEVGKKLGKEKLNEYIKKFGFGTKSNVDLPGEAKGIVKSTNSITDVDLATISFGQTNTVNSIQFMAAFNAIANGGTWIQPHVMKEVSHIDDNNTKIVDRKFEPKTVKVVSEEKTKELRGYLERVVSEGSAKRSFIEGYHIAGKTGTAQKVNSKNGTYESGKYISSFVAMAPASDPKVTVMVSIDEASAGEYYAGVIVTPIAKILFNDIFNYFDPSEFPKDEQLLAQDVIIPEIRGLRVEEAKKKLKEGKLNFDIDGDGQYVTDVSPKPGYSVREDSKINLYTGNTAIYNKDIIVPDLKGYTREGATKLLDSIGVKAVFEGEGMIIEQSIQPGELVQKGTTIKCQLSNDLGD